MIHEDMVACAKASKLRGFEVPKAIHLVTQVNLLGQGFTVENDLLTPTVSRFRPGRKVNALGRGRYDDKCRQFILQNSSRFFRTSIHLHKCVHVTQICFGWQMKARRPQLLKRYQGDIDDLYSTLKAEGKI